MKKLSSFIISFIVLFVLFCFSVFPCFCYAEPSNAIVYFSFEANDEYTKTFPISAEKVVVTLIDNSSNEKYGVVLWGFDNYTAQIEVPVGDYTASARIDNKENPNFIIKNVTFSAKSEKTEYVHIYYTFRIPDYMPNYSVGTSSVGSLNNVDNSNNLNNEKHGKILSDFEMGQLLSIVFLVSVPLAISIIVIFIKKRRR